MTVEDFGQQLIDAAFKGALKVFSDGAFVLPEYSNRLKVDGAFMAAVWQMVDKEKLKEQLARRIEQELADRLINHMAAEMATDIKSILSVQERREALRAVARQHIDTILTLGKVEK